MTAAAPDVAIGHITAYVIAGLVAAMVLLVAGLRHAGTVQGRRAVERARAARDTVSPGGPEQLGAGGRAGLQWTVAGVAAGLAILLAALHVIGAGWAALVLAVAVVLAAPRRFLALARRGGGHAWRATGPARAGFTGAAHRRWNARQHQPLMFTLSAAARAQRDPRQTIEEQRDEVSMDNKTAGRSEGKTAGRSEGARKLQALRDSGWNGPVDQDGHIPDQANPVTRRMLGTLHALHAMRSNGGQPDAPAPTTNQTRTEGDEQMTTPQAPAAGAGTEQAGRGSVPEEWKQVVAATADFEPDDDSELLEWMAAEVAGMSAYAEALTEVYETCVHSLGVDPAAMNAVHDTADAAADAATAMAYARNKFGSHYAEVREFAASGGLLPYDGRWITGDGDA